MSARPIAPGDYTPPPPEIRHLFGSFAELRARIRARRAPGVGVLTTDGTRLDRESLKHATQEMADDSGGTTD